MTMTRMAMTDAGEPEVQTRAANVSRLRPRERMVFDHVRLAEVCDAHGPHAESYIACILDEIETQVAAAAEAPDAEALAGSCRDLVMLSDAIGMQTMGHAAQALLECLISGAADTTRDAATRAACLHRLLRLGRPTGTGGWEMASGTGPDTVA